MRGRELKERLGPPVVPTFTVSFFGWEGFATQIDYRIKGPDNPTCAFFQ